MSISRKGVKLNLASMLFSKPEVESSHIPHEDQASYRSQSDSGLLIERQRNNAVIVIQKYARGYLARVKVTKQKEVKEFLNRENKLDIETHEKIGEGLKLSDLSLTPNAKQENACYNRNSRKQDFMISEIVYKPGDSKLENSESILMDSMFQRGPTKSYLNDKDNKENIFNKNTNKFENGGDRDLNNKEMAIHIQESPLCKYFPEDEISIISSRIETNRKGFHNTTIDVFSSARKEKLKNSSLKIYNQISQNKGQCNPKNIAAQNFKRFVKNNGKHKDWKSSLSYLKKTNSAKKLVIAGEHKDSIDAILKTHRAKARKELLPTSTKKTKKRPGSAGNNQKKCNQFDISKMQASLKLLKKSFNKSNASSKEKSENGEQIYQTSRGPIVPAKLTENKDMTSAYKRQNRKLPVKRRNGSDRFDYTKSNQTNSNMLVQTPKHNETGNESYNESKLKKMFKNELNIDASKKSNSQVLSNSNISTGKEKGFKYLYSEQMREYKLISETVEKEAKKKATKIEQLRREHQISDDSFDRRIKGIEKWKKTRKKEIKKKEVNFIQLLGSLQKQTYELKNFKKNIFDTEDSKLISRNVSSVLVDDSADSINLNKVDASDFNLDKHITPLRDISSSNILKGVDFMGASNVSVMNSALKNNSIINKSIPKGNDHNMSIDSSR